MSYRDELGDSTGVGYGGDKTIPDWGINPLYRRLDEAKPTHDSILVEPQWNRELDERISPPSLRLDSKGKYIPGLKLERFRMKGDTWEHGIEQGGTNPTVVEWGGLLEYLISPEFSELYPSRRIEAKNAVDRIQEMVTEFEGIKKRREKLPLVIDEKTNNVKVQVTKPAESGSEYKIGQSFFATDLDLDLMKKNGDKFIKIIDTERKEVSEGLEKNNQEWDDWHLRMDDLLTAYKRAVNWGGVRI